jgi:RNA polymerase sigma factor (sigma-70 family)
VNRASPAAPAMTTETPGTAEDMADDAGCAPGRPTGPQPEASDADIIRASLTDPERFAGLFDRHAPVIHRYLARRGGSGLADDLTAETFLAAFRRRDRYDCAHRDARPWLYGMATLVLAQHRRDEARQLRIRLAAVPEPHQPGHGERVAGDVTAAAIRGALAASLAGLPASDRDVLLLIAWEQLSYDEVARALDIPVGTVKSRLSRARTRLRSALAGTELSSTIEEILTNE